MSTPPPERPPARPDRPTGPGTPGPAPKPWSRWVTLGIVGVVALVLIMTTLNGNPSPKVAISYSQFSKEVAAGTVKSVNYDPQTGKMSGKFTKPVGGQLEFTSAGPNNDLQATEIKQLQTQGVDVHYTRETSNPWLPILVYLLPIAALIGFFVWMNRRAQGQMGAVMNIGKSRAKVYDAEKPSTTFGDVAGYEPVKQEITEVVDFLKNPGKFKEIGARIPRGVLLVGPPGTG